MDAYVVKQGAQSKLGFLCVEWAFVSDVDLQSEVLRCCGESDYHFWLLESHLLCRSIAIYLLGCVSRLLLAQVSVFVELVYCNCRLIFAS